MRWVDDSSVKPGFDGMIKKDAVEHRTGVWFQTERDIADSEYGEYFWQFYLDAFNRFECFDACRL